MYVPDDRLATRRRSSAGAIAGGDGRRHRAAQHAVRALVGGDDGVALHRRPLAQASLMRPARARRGDEGGEGADEDEGNRFRPEPAQRTPPGGSV